MEHLNTGGKEPHAYNQNSNIARQEIINKYYISSTEKVKIEGARPINDNLKKVIEQVKRPASAPLTDVIDFRNELRERHERQVQEIPTKHLRFRKNNGRIIAEVESYEKEHGKDSLNEESDKTQEILKSFLINNDKERNEEL